MLRLMINWVLSALSLLIVARFIPGFVVEGFGTALVAAIVIGLVNATIGFLLKIITFPITLITFGVFWFVINAIMLRLAAEFVPGFSIAGFWPAFLGALVLSLCNVLIRAVSHEIAEEKK